MSRTALYAFTALLALAAPALSTPVPQGAAVAKRADHSGQATYFYVGLGACGWNSVDSDWVVALDTNSYNGGEHCGKTITMTATGDDGSTTTGSATVVDECPTCGDGSVDLSPSFFQNFKSLDVGTFDMSWSFDS
ncbi:RlpA-like double-psi beta-barrel-protein domain-containing protein-containing protein [Schizophyllum amplum]|uniref:RlpA-like double-psi beta-barrel-protein domain-containing protein-containing protein n=1 Tax=Schizophyllum amplum TaxID=97359 RepID=A0A550CWJ4_9AGAR|nr:RlpA-like double-psi beta-barrel-protein domain-containing protein-containing protein [Auriculariopsis ampla]